MSAKKPCFRFALYFAPSKRQVLTKLLGIDQPTPDFHAP
jgi:hypothetical protein